MTQSLRERISQGVANVDGLQLRHAWEEFEYRGQVCCVTSEVVEHLPEV
jgi:hypothetical protein